MKTWTHWFVPLIGLLFLVSGCGGLWEEEEGYYYYGGGSSGGYVSYHYHIDPDVWIENVCRDPMLVVSGLGRYEVETLELYRWSVDNDRDGEIDWKELSRVSTNLDYYPCCEEWRLWPTSTLRGHTTYVLVLESDEGDFIGGLETSGCMDADLEYYFDWRGRKVDPRRSRKRHPEAPERVELGPASPSNHPPA